MTSFLIKNSVLILIIAVAAITRFYQLGNNPPELYVDEVSNGYNAYSILKTARDEYGNFLPLTFRAFGDYNPALSVYLLVPAIAVFGANEFAVRFPSALLGTLTVLLTYFLTKKLFESASNPSANQKHDGASLKIRSEKPVTSSAGGGLSEAEISKRTKSTNSRAFFDGGGVAKARAETIAVVAMLLLAISPWHLQFSRYDHEANFMVAFTVLAITLFLFSKNNYKVFVLSAISFAAALNTYQGAKIWVPLVLLALVVLYRKQLTRWKFKLLLPVLIVIVGALPIVTNLSQSTIRAQSVGIFEKDEPLKLFISGYLSHFSPNFLFITPDTIGRHSVPGMGHLYVFELPLILLGILFLIRNKIPHKNLIISWLALSPIPAALATPTPHALRSITFLPIFSILAAVGLVTIIKARLNFKFKATLLVCLAMIAAYNIVTYFHLYYKHYPKLKAADWNGGYKEMVKYVDSIKDNYEVVTITNFYGHPYIFILFYSKYDPAAYHPQSQNKNKFDKFEFFGASWDKKVTGTALVVRPHWQKPDPPPKYIKEIYDSASTLVFRISEEQ